MAASWDSVSELLGRLNEDSNALPLSFPEIGGVMPVRLRLELGGEEASDALERFLGFDIRFAAARTCFVIFSSPKAP